MINFKREKININGCIQDIEVISTDIENPLLLMLHGGPGVPDRALIKTFNTELANRFTLVCWDQRGSGHNYTAECIKEPLTISLMLYDLDCLVSYLLNKFSKKKLYISGHSFGTNLGVRYISKHFEKVVGYVGTGQYVSDRKGRKPHFDFAMKMATENNDMNSIKMLKSIGELKDGRYNNDKSSEAIVRKISQKYGSYCYDSRNITPFIPMYIKEYGIHIFSFLKGIKYSINSPVEKEIADSEFVSEYTNFKVPVIIISGERDYICPITTAMEWFEQISAPAKDFIVIPSAAHMVCFEKPTEWNNAVKRICEI